MEYTGYYKNEVNGYFFELRRIEKKEEIIFEKGLFRAVWSKSSSGCVDKDGYHSTFGENQLFFCTPYHHKIVQNENAELYMFSFSHEFLRSPMLNNGFVYIYPLFLGLDFDNSVQLPASLKQDFDYLVENLIDELNTERSYKEEMIRLTFSKIVIYYLRMLSKRNDCLIKLQNYNSSGLLEQFYLMVEYHYKTKHQVKEYAELLNTTTVMLSNAFRNFPMSPLKLIHQRILLEAKRLLAYSDLSIKQISYELGFQETTHFYQFFKKNMGITPKEFQISLEKGADTVVG